MKIKLILFALFIPNLLMGQYRLYEEGIKKYNEKDYYTAIELFSDFLTKPLHDKKFDADSYYWRGLAAFRLNDFEAASEDLKQSLSLKHPNAGNIHWFLAKSLDKLNQYEASAVEYGDAIKIFDLDKNKKAQLLAERAQVYIKLDKGGAALQDLQVASTFDPKNETIKEELGKLTNQSRNVALNGQQKTDINKKVDPASTNRTQAPPVTQKQDDVKLSQPIVQKTDDKKTPVVEQKEGEKKTEVLARNEPLKKDLETQNVIVPPSVVAVPGQKEDAKLSQPIARKADDKKTPAGEQKQGEKKAEPVVTIPVQSTPVEPKEPTLAELYNDEKKYALVIGNSAYPKEIGVLKNPVNDATDFAEAIKKLGFEVTLITNASYGKTRAEMMKFRDKLNLGERDKTVGLFYYAGHGLQNDNENYIVPVDAELQYQDDIARYCFPIQKMVLTQMENTNSRMNIVILDACRNNPFPALHRGIGENQGLGELKKARGAFIAYATSPGSVASDGTGRNGLYTQELIKAMNKPNRTIEQVFKEVRASVLKQSDDRQNPWENSNIIGDFYFKIDQ